MDLDLDELDKQKAQKARAFKPALKPVPRSRPFTQHPPSDGAPAGSTRPSGTLTAGATAVPIAVSGTASSHRDVRPLLGGESLPLTHDSSVASAIHLPQSSLSIALSAHGIIPAAQRELHGDAVGAKSAAMAATAAPDGAAAANNALGSAMMPPSASGTSRQPPLSLAPKVGVQIDLEPMLQCASAPDPDLPSADAPRSSLPVDARLVQSCRVPSDAEGTAASLSFRADAAAAVAATNTRTQPAHTGDAYPEAEGPVADSAARPDVVTTASVGGPTVVPFGGSPLDDLLALQSQPRQSKFAPSAGGGRRARQAGGGMNADKTTTAATTHLAPGTITGIAMPDSLRPQHVLLERPSPHQVTAVVQTQASQPLLPATQLDEDQIKRTALSVYDASAGKDPTQLRPLQVEHQHGQAAVLGNQCASTGAAVEAPSQPCAPASQQPPAIVSRPSHALQPTAASQSTAMTQLPIGTNPKSAAEREVPAQTAAGVASIEAARARAGSSSTAAATAPSVTLGSAPTEPAASFFPGGLGAADVDSLPKQQRKAVPTVAPRKRGITADKPPAPSVAPVHPHANGVAPVAAPAAAVQERVALASKVATGATSSTPAEAEIAGQPLQQTVEVRDTQALGFQTGGVAVAADAGTAAGFKLAPRDPRAACILKAVATAAIATATAGCAQPVSRDPPDDVASAAAGRPSPRSAVAAQEISEPQMGVLRLVSGLVASKAVVGSANPEVVLPAPQLVPQLGASAAVRGTKAKDGNEEAPLAKRRRGTAKGGKNVGPTDGAAARCEAPATTAAASKRPRRQQARKPIPSTDIEDESAEDDLDAVEAEGEAGPSAKRAKTAAAAPRKPRTKASMRRGDRGGGEDKVMVATQSLRPLTRAAAKAAGTELEPSDRHVLKLHQSAETEASKKGAMGWVRLLAGMRTDIAIRRQHGGKSGNQSVEDLGMALILHPNHENLALGGRRRRRRGTTAVATGTGDSSEVPGGEQAGTSGALQKRRRRKGETGDNCVMNVPSPRSNGASRKARRAAAAVAAKEAQRFRELEDQALKEAGLAIVPLPDVDLEEPIDPENWSLRKIIARTQVRTNTCGLICCLLYRYGEVGQQAGKWRESLVRENGADSVFRYCVSVYFESEGSLRLREVKYTMRFNCEHGARELVPVPCFFTYKF
ncbi:hypothetical protein Vretimale_11675 [Volvox reticuliferus]|uniref:Uncharacterized protein n=1 Tax=Volvox reticuliferus TaxID=1737510 RepID=A0A8J4GIM9_9CHLO|nr:hypothetical protein Vretifemale_14667 [Volvox reticuliferus]GIM07607.1 hypothetical protein Vretimale_11675 [Volvox reticuliferus]